MATNCFLGISLFSLLFHLQLLSLQSESYAITTSAFSIEEASIQEIQQAFKQNKLTPTQLVEFYIQQINKLNPILKGVIEINPDAQNQAKKAEENLKLISQGIKNPVTSDLLGIPILLKDSIATKDKLNTTAGSFALLGSVVPRDAWVVKKLRDAGAIILGKASMSEWAHFRSFSAPSGWNARCGQGKNPYVLSATPCECGSSSGPAISVASNMVAVSLGTETDGSILCPASYNSVVGIKPTVGLTSRAGVVPVSPRQDTIGPICRTVSDAVYVLDAVVGYDHDDGATKQASKYIPQGGYKQFLNPNGLIGKRLGIVRKPFVNNASDPEIVRSFQHHVETLRREGAVVIDNLEIPEIDDVLDSMVSGEGTALLAEFKISLNEYLQGLVKSPVRSLADIIAFNDKFSCSEMTIEFGQDVFLAAEATNGTRDAEKAALSNLQDLSRNGFEKLMMEKKLDCLVAVGSDISPVLAIDGFPGINIPAGYDSKGVPFGISFGGLKGTEPKLIEIAYAFEQASMIRKPPSFTSFKAL